MAPCHLAFLSLQLIWNMPGLEFLQILFSVWQCPKLQWAACLQNKGAISRNSIYMNLASVSNAKDVSEGWEKEACGVPKKLSQLSWQTKQTQIKFLRAYLFCALL